MNEKRATLTLILALVFLSVSPGGIGGSPKNKLEAYTDSEGYAVLSQLLDSDAKGWKNTVIRLDGLTVSRTEMAHESLRRCTELAGEFQAAAKDFEGKTQQRFALRKMFTTKIHYTLLKEKKALPDGISGGVYYVSPVGFDQDKTHGIAFVDYVCGGLCGAGSFNLLVKGAGGWEYVGGCSWQY